MEFGQLRYFLRVTHLANFTRAADQLGISQPALSRSIQKLEEELGLPVSAPRGLVGAVPLTDAARTAPVVAGGRVYAVGAAGVAFAIDAKTLDVVWCLDASDGSLVWQSEPANREIHAATIADDFLFTHSQYQNGYLIDRWNGKILRTLTEGYKCTREIRRRSARATERR